MSQDNKILVVDTEIENIKFIDELLVKNEFMVFSAFNAKEAIKKAEETNANLIIINSSCDIDAFQVLKEIKEKELAHFVPIVMFVRSEDKEIREKGIGLGVDCFLRHPINGNEILAVVRSLGKVKSLNEQIEGIEDVFYGLVKIIDAKDSYTKGHSERVTRLATILAKELSLPKGKIRLIEKAAKLHDIGKIGVSETILNKPGALTEEEYEQIKMHPVMSEKICSSLASLAPILKIIRYHHERYDGRGYPDGLKGEEIPLEARIIAVVDCFDAMATDRPYRGKLPKERIIAIFEAGAGTQWDKNIVEVFLKMIKSNVFEKLMLYNED